MMNGISSAITVMKRMNSWVIGLRRFSARMPGSPRNLSINRAIGNGSAATVSGTQAGMALPRMKATTASPPQAISPPMGMAVVLLAR